METHKEVQKIIKEFNENINSHVFLIETDNIDSAYEDIKKIIKENIKDDISKEQIDNETYIELTIIKPLNKDIGKDEILNLQQKIKTKPILSDNQYYIIYKADQMNLSASNKLLKTIEEPYEGTIGFLITTNVDLIIPTIKSRCEIISIMYNTKEEEELSEVNDVALKFIEILEEGNLYDWHQYSSEIKDIKELGIDIANKVKNYYTDAAKKEKTIKIIEKNNKYDTIVKKSMYLNKSLTKLKNNMNGLLLLETLYINLKKVK